MESVPNMNPGQFFAESRRRNIRKLAVAGATAGMLLTLGSATLLGIFEAVAWVMKAFVAALAPGKGRVPARYPDQSMR